MANQGSGGDKQIKLSVAIDGRSFDQAKAALRDLTALAQNFVKTLNGANMGSFFGGASGRPLSSSGGGIGAPGKLSAGGSGGITGGITADAKALAGTARLGIDAIRGMTSGIREGVSGQIREIEKLKSALRDLNQEFEKIGSQSGGAMDVGYVRQMQGTRQQLRNAIAGHEIANANQNRLIGQEGGIVGAGQRVVNRGGIDYVEDAAKARPGLGARMAAGYEQGGMLGAAGGAFGISKMAMGATMAAITTGIALAGTLSNAGQASAVTNAGYRLQEPLREGRMGARIGGSVGQLGMQIRGGDLASSIAYTHMLSKGTLGATGRSSFDTDRIELAMDQAGMGATLGAGTERSLEWAGRGANKLFGRTGSGGDRAVTELKMANARAAWTAEKAEEMAEQVRNMVASSPKAASMFNAAYGDAFSNIGMGRTGGIGLGINRRTGNTHMAEFKERALGAGYDPGSVASARASLGATAGRGLMYAGQTMLGLGLGGYGNAGQVYGAGAQFGIGGGSKAANAFLQASQRGMGTGGMDVTAGSGVAGMVASMMTGGGFAGASGSSLMEGMMSVGKTGTIGGDMRMARILQSGMGEFGKNLAGGTDPLQQGINMLSANASGAQGWYAKKALMGMDPGQMIESLRSGKMPQYLSDQGLTMGQLQTYNKTRNAYSFSRYIDEEGGGSATSKAVAGVKGAGGVAEYMKKMGISVGSAEGQRLIQQLGTARQATEGGQLEGNIGAIYAEIASDPMLAKKLKGKGAGAVGIKGTIAGAVAANEAAKAKQQGEFETEHEDQIKVGVRMMESNEKALAGLTSNLVKGATDFDGALKVLTGAIMDSLSVIAPAKAAELRKQAREHASDAKERAAAPGHAGASTTTIPTVGGGSRTTYNRGK